VPSCLPSVEIPRSILRVPPLVPSLLPWFPVFFTGIPDGPKVRKMITHISLVGDVVKRARNSDCEEDREPGSTGGPLEVLVAVHLHLCGRS
jgi:hypothetical protein